MSLDDLITDQIALPRAEDIVRDLIISNHVNERIVERSRGFTDARSVLLNAPDLSLSRSRPQWQAESENGKRPAFYLLFALEDGDQGCLLLNFHRNHRDRLIAVTFLSRDHTLGEISVALQPFGTERAQILVDRLHYDSLSTAREAAGEKSQIRTKRPPWLHGSDDIQYWYWGAGWAAELRHHPLGPDNRFHFHWGRLFFQNQERKARARASYQRRQRNKQSKISRRC